MDTISVIVPVYNIDQYVSRCVESIVGQSYTKLQIILVDDGSEDDSGKVCDELAEKDERIEVIHKVNGGLSDARNKGIEHARGQFLAFIDGDDYIERDMLEVLYKEITINSAEIASCGFYEEFPDQIRVRCHSKNTAVLDRVQAYKTLFSGMDRDILGCSSCNKLFRKELFDTFQYEKGMQSEDLQLIYRLLNNVDKVVCVNAVKYHYVHRQGSITASSFNKRSMDVIRISEELVCFIRDNYPQIVMQAYSYQAGWLLGIYQLAYEDRKKTDTREERKIIIQMIRSQLKWNWRNPHLDWGSRVLLWAVALHSYPLANWLLRTGAEVKKSFLAVL